MSADECELKSITGADGQRRINVKVTTIVGDDLVSRQIVMSGRI